MKKNGKFMLSCCDANGEMFWKLFAYIGAYPIVVTNGGKGLVISYPYFDLAIKSVSNGYKAVAPLENHLPQLSKSGVLICSLYASKFVSGIESLLKEYYISNLLFTRSKVLKLTPKQNG